MNLGSAMLKKGRESILKERAVKEIALFCDRRQKEEQREKQLPLLYISYHLSAPSCTDANLADKTNTPTEDSCVFKSNGNLTATQIKDLRTPTHATQILIQRRR